jgi:hypothetical protein
MAMQAPRTGAARSPSRAAPPAVLTASSPAWQAAIDSNPPIPA